MTWVLTLGGHSEPSLWDRIKSGGSKAQQGLSSWLTGGSPPALNPGFYGAGSATSDPAASGGLFGVKRLARQSRALATSRGFASWIFRRNIERFARGYDRVDAICAARSIRFFASCGVAAAHIWCTGEFCRTTQLGSIAAALQSTRRAKRCVSRFDQTRSAHCQRTRLRSSLCEHAIRQRVLFAGAPRREAPEIRSLRLRAFQ